MKIGLPVVDRRSLDNSIASTLSRCPRLAFYNYRLARSPRENNFPIQFGVAYHKFREKLEVYYRKLVLENGDQFEKIAELIFVSAYAEAVAGWQEPPEWHGKSYLTSDRFHATCVEAFDNWKREKNLGSHKVIASETAFELPLPRRFCPWCRDWKDETYCSRCRTKREVKNFSGKFDQIIEWNNRLWVRDFKTVSYRANYQERYNPDHQFTGYVWAAKQLSGRDIEGVLIEVVFNDKNHGPEFSLVLASRSRGDVEFWLEWFEWIHEQWDTCCRTDKWPMITSTCHDYGGCFFKRACNSGSWQQIADFLNEKTKFEVWDPMAV